jgi:hypothetical protein
MDFNTWMTAFFASELYTHNRLFFDQLGPIIAGMAIALANPVMAAVLPQQLTTSIKWINQIYALLRKLIDWLAINYGNATNQPKEKK